MKISRRNFISASSVSIAAGLLKSQAALAQEIADEKHTSRVKQSVCQWCFSKEPLDKFAQYCAQIGLKSKELVSPDQWHILKKHGLICAMTPSHRIEKGLNRIENHDHCIEQIRNSIEITSQAGFPNVICFSGNREGMADDEGLDNCEIALKKIVGFAEKKNVTICMELLNSKRNHKDYMCDQTQWGAELVRRVASDNFKLLYDIYHMQVQQGDVIDTIREFGDCIGHYHTAGVPGRNEIDDTQELYYPAIIRAIVDTGFKGYIGQEFMPKRNPYKSLAQAVQICDV